MPLLDALDINVSFGGHAAVIDAHLSAEAGSISGLIGPNGAGKTTLFNVLTGLQPPASGRVVLDGADITTLGAHERARRGLARTFQRLELFGSLTVEENLLVAAEAAARSGHRVAERVDSVLHLTGVAPLIEMRGDELTTGQARLVELARALVTDPRVLLLDEPASGLDADETEAFAVLLRKLVDDGLAIVLVEHDVPLVMRVCDRLTVMDIGRVIASGAPDEVRNDERVIAAYLGRPAEEAV